jgi:hypothetical protein
LESDLPKVKRNLFVSLLRFLSIKIGVPPKEFSFNLELCGKPAIMFKNVTANDFYSLSGAFPRNSTRRHLRFISGRVQTGEIDREGEKSADQSDYKK